MINIRVQCSWVAVSGKSCVFHVFTIKSDKAFGHLFKVKAWRYFSPLPIFLQCSLHKFRLFSDDFLVINSETSQFISFFLCDTFKGFWVVYTFLVLMQKNVSYLHLIWTFRYIFCDSGWYIGYVRLTRVMQRIIQEFVLAHITICSNIALLFVARVTEILCLL